jgi:hypothetical protein
VDGSQPSCRGLCIPSLAPLIGRLWRQEGQVDSLVSWNNKLRLALVAIQISLSLTIKCRLVRQAQLCCSHQRFHGSPRFISSILFLVTRNLTRRIHTSTFHNSNFPVDGCFRFQLFIILEISIYYHIVLMLASLSHITQVDRHFFLN